MLEIRKGREVEDVKAVFDMFVQSVQVEKYENQSTEITDGVY